MRTALALITPPVVEPVSLVDAKSHLRVDIADDDMLISSLITTAREYCESFQGRAYVSQALALILDGFPSGAEIVLPRPPLRSVERVVYTTAAGVTTTWPSTNYIVDTASRPGRLLLAPGATWPAGPFMPMGVDVEYTAGYGVSAAQVPARVKQAILLLIGDWYERREATAAPSAAAQAAEALLWQDRMLPI